MSRPDLPDLEPQGATARAAAEHIIVPRVTDLGGIKVRRALPAKETQMVGPFIFFDEFGPGEFLKGKGLDVRPHPHIGLSTVTYLFDGAIMHRDSLGSEQLIRPGELNLMTAGKAIVHSERTPQEMRDGAKLYGIQTWMALPKRLEESEPSFVHHGMEDMPEVEDGGMRLRVVMGSMFGKASAARAPTQTFYGDAALAASAVLPFGTDYEERAVYVSSGAIEIDGERYDSGRLIVLRPGLAIEIRALADARLLVFGGEPMDGPRYIWWNFVSSRKDAMMQAAEDWENGRMPAVPGDSEEFIPLDGARPKLKERKS
ncbi:MAG: pirin family protein [Beijerinckiaceae bacterium]